MDSSYMFELIYQFPSMITLTYFPTNYETLFACRRPFHLHIIPILVYVLLKSVINIHVGNEHAQGCLHFSLHLHLGKAWILFPLQLWVSSRADCQLVKEKFDFKPVKFCLKLTLCRVIAKIYIYIYIYIYTAELLKNDFSSSLQHITATVWISLFFFFAFYSIHISKWILFNRSLYVDARPGRKNSHLLLEITIPVTTYLFP